MSCKTVHNPMLGVCYCDSNMTFNIYSLFLIVLMKILKSEVGLSPTYEKLAWFYNGD